MRGSRVAPVIAAATVLLVSAGCDAAESGQMNLGQDSGLSELTVAPEAASEDYDRDKFEHWEQVSGTNLPDNCDAREATLYRQGDGVEVDGACEATSGSWTSVYTGETITNDSDVDIDHFVPLAEAWRSGASEWSDQRREQFANDITRPQLVAVDSSSNRSKGDSDPAEWRPEIDRCDYTKDWIEVKNYYDLTVNQAEHDALEKQLAEC